MFIETVEAVRLGAEIYENQGEWKRWVRQLWQKVSQGKLRLLVFGPAGVGKSTFGRFLVDEHDPGSDANYVASTGKETYALPGNVLCDVIVPPGQEDRQSYQWSDLFNMLRDGQSAGIVNVVSYGYHSMRDLRYTESPAFEEGMDKKEFLEAYLTRRREKELNVIRKLKTRIEDAEADPWMMTLVAKQDLWWEERSEVQKWYSEGPYGDVIREIKSERGERNFQHLLTSASFIIRNFVDGENNVLATKQGEYDEMHKLAHQQRLSKQVHELVNG